MGLLSFVGPLGALLGLAPQERPPTRTEINAFFGALYPGDPSLATDPSGDAPRSKRLGGSGTTISAGVIEDIDNNFEVRGEKWTGTRGQIGIAGKMLRDPHVRQSLAYISDPLGAGTWRFHPVSNDPLDVEIANFLTYSFFERLPWPLYLRRMVRGFGASGFELSEMTDDVLPIPVRRFPLHPGGGRGIVPTGLHQIPANTVERWQQHPTNPDWVSSITQYVAGPSEASGFRDIPGDRIVRMTWDQDGANFRGLSILRSAYQPWKLKMLFLTLDAIKHERNAVGTPGVILGPDATEDDIDAAETILSEMRSNDRGYYIFPDGYKFEWSGAGEDKVTNISVAIERCNTDIAWNVSAGYMRLGLTGAGSFALGSTQQGAHHLAVDTVGKFICSALTVGSDGWSPAERIVRLNYGEAVEIPRAMVRNLPTRNWSEVAKTVFQGASAGVIVPDDALEDAIRESMELPHRDPETARAVKAPTVAARMPSDPNDSPGETEDTSGDTTEDATEDTTEDSTEREDQVDPQPEATI